MSCLQLKRLKLLHNVIYPHLSVIAFGFPLNDFCANNFGDVGEEIFPFRISSVDKFLFIIVIGGGSSLSMV